MDFVQNSISTAQNATRGAVSWIYRAFISPVTVSWYREALACCSDESVIVDVGIGPGSSLLCHQDTIAQKKLKIIGVEPYDVYAEACKQAIESSRVSGSIDVVQSPFEEFSVPENLPVDTVLFCASLMLVDDAAESLKRAKSILERAKGTRKQQILSIQTIDHTRSPFMEWIKPRIKHFTSVDFGRVTYPEDIELWTKKAGLELKETRILRKGWFRDFVLYVIELPDENR